jgi:response regulator RpfG family c-di-GMP phosphodiesterase
LALRVLIVDPDEDWLDKTASLFKEQLYEVEVSSNGKDAQVKLYGGKFFAVVMNYATKNHSAHQVLKFIKRAVENNPRVLVYIEEEDVGDEDDPLDKKLRKEGVDEVLIKPFEIDVLLAVLEGHQGIGDLMNSLPKRKGQKPEEEISMEDGSFTAVKITEFYSLKAVLFDVYIKLSSGRYIKFLHSGDEFSKDRVDKYKNEKGVDYLYFHVKDRKKYIKFNDHLAKKMVKSDKLDSKNKINMLKNVTEKFMEEAFQEGIKPVIVEQGKQICETVYSLIESNDDLYIHLRNYQDFDPSAFSHAYLCTLFTASIIKQFEWQSKTMIESASLACMFHDIGKLNLDPELLTMRPKDMNEAQLEEYQKHPIYGVDILQTNKSITQPVKQIILQHHEAFDGTGFPSQLKGQKILTLANIAALADQFSHIIIEQNLKPVDALKFILTQADIVAKFNPEIMEKFIQVFVHPNKIKRDRVLPGKSRMVPSKKAS